MIDFHLTPFVHHIESLGVLRDEEVFDSEKQDHENEEYSSLILRIYISSVDQIS